MTSQLHVKSALDLVLFQQLLGPLRVFCQLLMLCAHLLVSQLELVVCIVEFGVLFSQQLVLRAMFHVDVVK